jgi:hypothetical protein
MKIRGAERARAARALTVSSSNVQAPVGGRGAGERRRLSAGPQRPARTIRDHAHQTPLSAGFAGLSAPRHIASTGVLGDLSRSPAVRARITAMATLNELLERSKASHRRFEQLKVSL